jgi:hypothetical protein
VRRVTVRLGDVYLLYDLFALYSRIVAESIAMLPANSGITRNPVFVPGGFAKPSKKHVDKNHQPGYIIFDSRPVTADHGVLISRGSVSYRAGRTNDGPPRQCLPRVVLCFMSGRADATRVNS